MALTRTRAPDFCRSVKAGSCTRPTSTCPWRNASRRLTPMVANFTLVASALACLRRKSASAWSALLSGDADGLALEILDRLDLACRLGRGDHGEQRQPPGHGEAAEIGVHV